MKFIICRTTETYPHTDGCFETQSLSFFPVLLIWCFHAIHHSDHYHHTNHHSCIWDAAFHQYGLLTSAPLEINLCILINHTLLMQHPSLMRCGKDRDWCGSMLSCWFNIHTYTISSPLQHWSMYTPNYQSTKNTESQTVWKSWNIITLYCSEYMNCHDKSYINELKFSLTKLNSLKTEIVCYFYHIGHFSFIRITLTKLLDAAQAIKLWWLKDLKDCCLTIYTHIY